MDRSHLVYLVLVLVVGSVGIIAGGIATLRERRSNRRGWSNPGGEGQGDLDFHPRKMAKAR